LSRRALRNGRDPDAKPSNQLAGIRVAGNTGRNGVLYSGTISQRIDSLNTDSIWRSTDPRRRQAADLSGPATNSHNGE
jgi:hypothetical protein